MFCCQLWFNSTKSIINKLSTSYNSVLRRLSLLNFFGYWTLNKYYYYFFASLSHTVQVTCLLPGEFHHLQNFCVNLFIDLQNELKLAQILSLQHVYPHCYIFHPLNVNGGVLYFMSISLRNTCMY